AEYLPIGRIFPEIGPVAAFQTETSTVRCPCIGPMIFRLGRHVRAHLKPDIIGGRPGRERIGERPVKARSLIFLVSLAGLAAFAAAAQAGPVELNASSCAALADLEVSAEKIGLP